MNVAKIKSLKSILKLTFKPNENIGKTLFGICVCVCFKIKKHKLRRKNQIKEQMHHISVDLQHILLMLFTILLPFLYIVYEQKMYAIIEVNTTQYKG